MSYPGQSLGGGSYPSAEVQSVYSTAPADWEKRELRETERVKRGKAGKVKIRKKNKKMTNI